MKNNSFKHAHPAMMIPLIKKFFFLAVLPAVEGVLAVIGGRPLTLALCLSAGAALLICAFAVFSWRAVRYAVQDGGLTVHKGVLRKSRVRIPLAHFSTLTVSRSVLLNLMGAVRLLADTEAGHRKKADVALYVHERDLKLLIPPLPGTMRNPVTFSLRSQLLAAVSISNPAAGLLFAAPVVNQLGKVLGRDFAEELYAAVDGTSQLLPAVIPRAAGFLALGLVLCWMVSAGWILFQNGRFVLAENQHNLVTRRGLIASQKALVVRKNVCGVVVRRLFLIWPQRQCSAKLICAGFSKSKGRSELFIPCVRQDEMAALIERAFGFDPQERPRLRPRKGFLVICILWPVLLFAALVAGVLVLARAWPHFADSLWFGLLVAAGICGFWLWRGLVGYRTGGIAFVEDRVVFRGQKKQAGQTAHLRADQIGAFVIRRRRWPVLGKSCRITAHVVCERGDAFTAYGLDAEQALARVAALLG